MDLFNPESGLVIWMLVVFLLVLFVLAKFAFPVISKSLSEREQRINNALKVADEAEAKLAHVEEERKKNTCRGQGGSARGHKRGEGPEETVARNSQS